MVNRKLQELGLKEDALRADIKTLMDTAGYEHKDGQDVPKIAGADLDTYHAKYEELEETVSARRLAEYDAKAGPFGEGNARPFAAGMNGSQTSITQAIQNHPAWQQHVRKDKAGNLKSDFHHKSAIFEIGDDGGEGTIDMKGILNPAKAGFDSYGPMSTTAGYPPFVNRTGQIVYLPEQQPTLVDFMPGGDTTQNSIKYMSESIFLNSAVETAELGTFPQSNLQYIELTQAVQKIPTYIPVSDEALEDVPELLSIIESRMGLMIRMSIQAHQINGSGVAPYLLGFLNASGLLTYASLGNNIDAVAGGIATVNSYGFAQANTARASAIVMNPTDYFKARTQKNSLGDYLMGAPNTSTALQTLWGLPVIQAADISAGTALVGDFANFSMFWTRSALTIEVGYSGTDFISGQKTIRATIRCSNQITRGSAFATVTGLA